MAKTVKAEWQNAATIMARLAEIAPNAAQAIADAQLQTMQETAEKIKTYAPVRRGKLSGGRSKGASRPPGTYRDSINAKLLSEAGGGRGRSTAGKTKVEDPNAVGLFGEFIWRWLEFGTIDQPARPHIFPVYRIMRKLMMRRAATALRKAIRGGGK